MAFLDVSRDYLTWPQRETVTYLPAPRNDLNRFPVTDAKRRALGFKDIGRGNGAYTSQDVAWWLPVATSQSLTGEYAMKPGDVIEDEDLTAWTVLEAQLGKLGQSWRLVCRNLVLQAGLRDKVTIIRPRVTTGPSGEPVYHAGDGEVAIVTDLAARVQPMGGSVETINGVEGGSEDYRVILGQEVNVRAFDRIVWRDKSGTPGPVLQFVSSNNQGRIDVLPELSCKAVR